MNKIYIFTIATFVFLYIWAAESPSSLPDLSTPEKVAAYLADLDKSDSQLAAVIRSMLGISKPKKPAQMSDQARVLRAVQEDSDSDDDPFGLDIPE
jgi:hypothetical protein